MAFWCMIVAIAISKPIAVWDPAVLETSSTATPDQGARAVNRMHQHA